MRNNPPWRFFAFFVSISDKLYNFYQHYFYFDISLTFAQKYSKSEPETDPEKCLQTENVPVPASLSLLFPSQTSNR